MLSFFHQDIATSFDNSEDKRQKLQAREKKLSRMIQAEDMNVLHQRIRLLNKQWDELKSQAGLRDHRLQDSTFRWSSLGEQMRALMDWIDDMEVKITSSREVHVEDLLNKLETVSIGCFGCLSVETVNAGSQFIYTVTAEVP